MSSDEFITGLQEALAGRVPEVIISDNVNYYRRYIDEQVRAGKREEDVLNMLGDPRLLAKTIEGSSQFADRQEQNIFSNMGGSGSYSSNGYSSGSYSSGEYSGGVYPEDNSDENNNKLKGWIVAGIIIIILIAVLMIAFRVFVFFLPLLIAIALISGAVKLIQKWLRL